MKGAFKLLDLDLPFTMSGIRGENRDSPTSKYYEGSIFECKNLQSSILVLNGLTSKFLTERC